MTTEKGGPPKKMPQDVIEKLKYAFQIGATIEIACGYAEISESLYYEWQQAGKNGDEEFIWFVDSIKAAKGKGAINWLKKIEEGDEKWQASAWKLERRYYKDYSANPLVRREFEELAAKVDNLAKKQEGDQNGRQAEEKLDQGCDKA